MKKGSKIVPGSRIDWDNDYKEAFVLKMYDKLIAGEIGAAQVAEAFVSPNGTPANVKALRSRIERKYGKKDLKERKSKKSIPDCQDQFPMGELEAKNSASPTKKVGDGIRPSDDWGAVG